MRRWIVGLILVLLVAPLAFVITQAATPADAPENISLDGCGEKQAAVAFPHKAHWELSDCTTCHHTAEGLTADSDTDVKTCKSCHVKPEEEGTPDCSQMSLKKNPYHMLCVDCHKKEQKGPTKCTECHPKG